MYKDISTYLSQDIYPFHMPGHKRNKDFFPKEFFNFDLTEIPEMDVLSEPKSIIKKFQNKISDFYCAKESFFLTNGASAGIVASITAACNENTPVFVPRNAHVSLYNGLVFSGAKPNYFLPEITHDGLAGGVSQSVFSDMPRGAVVFIVSPTYEGFVSDISSIAEKVHERDGVLIVDEAHGAHFSFHKYFPKSALSQGADIVINSLHKTLPAISGCAVLHVNSERVDLSRLRFYINAMQTTSPSYIMMAGCDFMLEKLWNHPELFDKYVSQLEKIRGELPCTTDSGALRLCGRERVGENAIYDIDAGKLLFMQDGKLLSEKSLDAMEHEYKVQFEMAKGRHLLAMTSVADTEEGFARLKDAILRFNEKFEGIAGQARNDEMVFTPVLPEMVLTPREAIQNETEEIPSEEAIGRISAVLIADYPPGIALVVPGERINKQVSKPHIRVVK